MDKSFGITPVDIFRLLQAACNLAERGGYSISDVIARLERGDGGFDVLPNPVSFARTAKRFRSNLKHQFGSSLFRYPVWDMLLDLLISDDEDRRVSVTSLSYGAGVPLTTGLRYLGSLEQSGFVIRHDDERDQRRTFIELVHDRKEDLLQLLAEWNRSLLTKDIQNSTGRTVETIPQRYEKHAQLHPVFLS